MLVHLKMACKLLIIALAIRFRKNDLETKREEMEV